MMLGKRRRLEQETNGHGPSYAILKLRPDTNCVLLFQHALSLGIVDISFVSHPREFFAASDAPLLPSQTPDTPHDEGNQGAPESDGVDRNLSPSAESPPQEITPCTTKQEVRSPSAESSMENETEPPTVSHVLATLFGKVEDAAVTPSSSNFDDSPPVIPSNGTTVCKICYAAVSCRKITNLSLHVLRSHCSIPLWKCPSNGCEYAHADSGKVRTHLRHQHTGEEGQPIDNRQNGTLEDARVSLKKCFPKVDWDEKYQNVFYLTEPPTLLKEERKPGGQPDLTAWDRLVIKDSMANQLMRCHGCQLTVPLNKKAIEEHIRVIHKPERPFQCGVCDYANPDEWKVRVHMALKHVDRPFAQVRTCNSWTRPHLFIRRFFPELAESLPVDEIETMLETFRPPPGRDLSSLVAPQPQLLPVIPTTAVPDPPNLTDATVESLLLQMFPAIRGATSLAGPLPQRKPSTGSTLRVDRLGGKVECALCLAQVEAKRTMLVSHCKSHCPQRQWQCPHCETSAAFHSKLKLHIVNAHKSDAEPLDHYTPDLENKWLLLFRQCFPQFAQQCYAEDWKFRSKQQQHYGSHIDDSWTRSFEGTDQQPRRTILIDGEVNAPIGEKPHEDTKPSFDSQL